ncbi:hypothetical protein GCM10017687_49940 [Streptomyces echinatus]
MPAVEQPDAVALVRELGQHDGGELLQQVPEGKRAAVPGAAGVQAADDSLQGRLVVRGLPEAVDHRRGRSYRGQALAPYIPDDQSHAEWRGDGFVEVAADPGLSRGREVHRLDVDVPDPAGQGTQEHFLSGVGDEAEL